MEVFNYQKKRKIPVANIESSYKKTKKKEKVNKEEKDEKVNKEEEEEKEDQALKKSAINIKNKTKNLKPTSPLTGKLTLLTGKMGLEVFVNRIDLKYKTFSN